MKVVAILKFARRPECFLRCSESDMRLVVTQSRPAQCFSLNVGFLRPSEDEGFALRYSRVDTITLSCSKGSVAGVWLFFVVFGWASRPHTQTHPYTSNPGFQRLRPGRTHQQHLAASVI